MSQAERYFPNDYREARARFIEAAEASDLGVTTRVLRGQLGPDGKPLFLDTAMAGPREAKSALLLISGTHGVEGYFGSGAQTGLLREGLARRMPKGVKLVLLHALNAFGFAWDRRVNEDNADINRNFVDHARPPKNDAYDSLAGEIAPDDISPDCMRAANARLRAYAKAHGDFALQEAVSAGQYRHPTGVYFGGQREAWSAAMLKDVFREELKGVENLVVVDFHTGLGEEGAAEMINEDLPGSPEYARAKQMWGARVRSSEAGESLSPPLHGTIDKAVARWMKGKQLTFAALEVGTRSTRDVFDALRRDNWLHLHARPGHRDWKAIKRQIRDAFYVDTPGWKRKVWDHAAGAVEAATRVIA
ncbi:MAG TPA: M14 family metallopeptidase [Rhizomicrobium sp.]|nr:M14 family metallopeptidase [Rhizomicrobium sp.]